MSPLEIALPCACKSTLPYFCICFVIIADFSWLIQLKIFCPALPSQFCGSWASVSISTEVPSSDSASWWLLARLVPTHRVTMETSLLCLIYLCRAPTNLSWHLFPTSSISDEFHNNNDNKQLKLQIIYMKYICIKLKCNKVL